MFHDLNVDQMVDVCANTLYNIMKATIPSRVLSIKDPPWITRQVKAIGKHKRKVFRRLVNGGRRKEDF